MESEEAIGVVQMAEGVTKIRGEAGKNVCCGSIMCDGSGRQRGGAVEDGGVGEVEVTN